jgi:Fe-S-cluster-containing hydrogenase component 2
MAVAIDGSMCTACGDCEPVCPTTSIFPHKGVFAVKEETCTECDGESDFPKCMEACMDDCISYVEN